MDSFQANERRWIMKKKHLIMSILFFMGALLIINPPVFGQQQYVMKFGLAGAPDINPTFWATHYNMFEYEVEKRSNGRIQVELIRGALGSPTDRMKQVMMGQIQGADTAEGPIAQVYKPVQVFSIPYLLETEQQAWRLFDGPFVQNLTEDLRKKTGLKVLHWWESGGFKQWTNSKKPIRTPSDMKGLKIRVMPSPVFQKLVSSLGGSPTPISFGELYGALKNKIVDGQNNALSLVNLFKYYQVQKYVTIDNNRGASRYTDHMAIEGLKKNGMEVYSLTPQERSQFKAKAQAPVLEWLRGEVGSQLVSGMLDAAKNAK
jgi:tripartite ATP-independent transporter DctP family solute receptor